MKFDYGNQVVKTELHQNVLLQVSVIEMHMYILKDRLMCFSWHNMKGKKPILFNMVFNYLFYHNYKR